MQFLVAVRSKEYSEETLKIGSSVANAFAADLSVLYVGPKPRQIMSSGLTLARDALLNWRINHPGVDVLLWTYKQLQSYEFISNDIEQFDDANIVEDAGRLRVLVPHVHGEKIRLIMREGEVLDQVKQETEFRDYQLTIVGGGDKHRLIRQLIQFLDTSIMFVKNFNPDWKYKVLLCVDDSHATKKAVVFGGTVAKHFDAHVNMVTVSKTDHFGEGYRGAADWAARYFERMHISNEQHFITNSDPATAFANFASEDHIIIMGKSKMNPLKAIFKGTTPGSTVIKSNCPVIVVK